MLLASACGRSSPDIEVPNEDTQAPSLAELGRLLDAEFQRLGIDPARAVAKAPSGDDNAVLDLGLSNIDPDGPGLGSAPPTAIRLSWTEQFVGDLNQDGLVSVQDLAPIGQNFKRQVSYDDAQLHGGIDRWPSGDPAGLGAPNWRLARVDGIADGVISVNDLTSIGVHFGERMDGYLIRRGVNRGNGSIEWDSQPLDLGTGSLVSVDRGAFSATAGQPFRYALEIPLEDAQFNQYFTVQGCDSQSQTVGPESLAASYSPNPGVDTEAPLWNSTIGVTKVQPGDQSLTVLFGTATDLQSPPVGYHVYYSQGDPQQPDAPFDFETASVLTVSSSPAVISGLANDEFWRAVVRAFDSAEQPNEEINAQVLGSRIGATDIYPPEWQGEAGLLDLYYGNGQALLVCNTAVDSQQDQFGLWESEPVVYRVYHGVGEEPDFAAAETLDFTDRKLESCVLPLTGLDTSKSHWFCVRPRDSAETPNEDSNSVVLVAKGLGTHSWPAPQGGPGVPAGYQPSGPSSFAFSPGLLDYRLVSQLAKDEDHWASAWRLTGSGYVAAGDFHLAAPGEAPDFALQGAALDHNSQLRLLFVRDATFGDHFTISEYRQSLGQSTNHTKEGDFEVNLCGYNINSEPFCIFDAFDTSVATGQTNFQFYMSGFPLSSANLIHDTATGSGPQVVNLWDWGYSRLSNGQIGLMLRLTDYISGAESFKLMRVSSSGHTQNSFTLVSDRLVGLQGNGSDSPLVVTESDLAGGKLQYLQDQQSSLSIGTLHAMSLRRSQLQASSMESYLAVLELASDSFYGSDSELRLQAVLIHGSKGEQKIPLLLEAGATSFKPLAVLDATKFVLSYYVPGGGSEAGSDRHLVLEFN